MTGKLTMQSLCGLLADPAGFVHRCKVTKADLAAPCRNARLPQTRGTVPAHAFNAGSVSHRLFGVGAVLFPVGKPKIAPSVVGAVAVDVVNVRRGLLPRHPGPYNAMRKISASEQADVGLIVRLVFMSEIIP